MFPSHCGGGGGGCWDSGWLNFAENSMKINYVDPPLILHTNLCFSVLLFHQIPPANEVWGKVIFSEACVKNSVNWGVPALEGACSGGYLLWGCCLLETPHPIPGRLLLWAVLILLECILVYLC